MILGPLAVPESKEVLKKKKKRKEKKNGRDMSKGYRNQFERTLAGSIWGNLNIKMNDRMADSPLNKI